MTRLPWWKRSVMVTGVTAVALAALAGQVRRGDSAEPAPQGQPFLYAGSKSCQLCHALTREEALLKQPKSAEFVHLDEYKTWETEDKHSIAYKRLLDPGGRGQRIGRLLKADVTDPKTGCLGCHSASTSEIQNRQGDQFDRTEGVSCENCHGPVSAWYFPHTQVNFRIQKKEDWAKVGFVDLRSPDQQSTKCLSCHIGKTDEGKVVTHEMYAAGHPPLPSIEVATFTNSIPRHWWLNAERKNPVLRKSLGYQDGQLEQTKLAMVGAAVALKTSLKLLADEANLPDQSGPPGQEWPDYARFDCWSCHHDLKRESWRQNRGYPDGPPGRVPVAQWPKILVELGIDFLAMNDPAAQALHGDLVRYEKVLHEQAYARPFGRRVGMAKAADDFAGWSDVLVQKLTASSYEKPSTAKLLRRLVERAEAATPDYDAARHVGWTIKLLTEELGDTLAKRTEIEAVIAKLGAGLKLDLPAGRKYEIEDQISAALQIIGDYEPATFQAQLRELLTLLPPS